MKLDEHAAEQRLYAAMRAFEALAPVAKEREAEAKAALDAVHATDVALRAVRGQEPKAAAKPRAEADRGRAR